MAVPCDTPVTNPNELTVAKGEALSQVPPALPLVLKAMDEPTQTAFGPLITPATADGFTDTLYVADDAPQILETVYDIVTLPGVCPVTRPVTASTEATAGALLAQVPPRLPLVLS